ncbi:tetracycline resistance element mobilization regulatory protein RteC [Filimonas lacunae]|nr:tetracycline resistance element mobilization regulatory protein RteC [Filimonas lacunae]
MSQPETLTLRYGKIAQTASDKIEQINQLLFTQEFNNEAEEINFFKNILPPLYATYMRYVSFYHIETRKPIGIKKTLERYFKKELKKIEDYSTQHAELSFYLKSGNTHLDHLYFVRARSINDHSVDNFFPAINKRCCTIYSLRIALLLANEVIKDYLYQSLTHIKESYTIGSIFDKSTFPSVKPLTWTGSKTDLIELAYALQTDGCFNEGKAQLNQIIEYLETIFYINLGNTTRVFQDILARKMGYTKFIDRLKNRLENRIEKIEEKNRK